MSSARNRRDGNGGARGRPRTLPSVRVAVELARTDIRRGLRWVGEQDFWRLYGLFSAAGLLFAAWRAFVLGRETGSALAVGDSAWFLDGGSGVLWGVVWLFVTGLLVVDAVGSNGDVANDGHYLTVRPATDLAAGKLLAAACKFSAFVYPPVLACFTGVALSLGTLTPLLGGLVAATVAVTSAAAVGYPVGFAAKGVIRRSESLTRLKPLLALCVGVGYVVVVASGEFTTTVQRLAPALRSPPLGWLADLSLLTTPGAGASPTAGAAALLAGTATVVVGTLLAVSAARYAWHADRVQPTNDGDGDDVPTSPTNRVDALFGTVTRASATRAVATTTLRRVSRSPLQLVFVAAPLVAAIPLGERVLSSGAVPWYAPWLVVWYGAWAAGAAVPLNPLGNQGATLPTVLTAPADGRHVVHGHVVAAALPAVPLTAGVAVALGAASEHSTGELAGLGLGAVAAVVAASVLAVGVGGVFPRFDAVDFAGSRRALPPSKVAYSVFSTALTLAVAAIAVLLDETARVVVAALFSRRLPVDLTADPSALTPVAWAVLALVALAVPAAYWVGVRRIDGYRLS